LIATKRASQQTKRLAMKSDQSNLNKQIHKMKNIQRSLLITLVPLLTPLTAFAETDKQSRVSTPVAGTKGNADSWRASQVIGTDVKNAGDETIGEVEDLVLDVKGGEILAVIISSGGFLGVDDTLSAVPVTALRYDDRAKAFKTKLTKEQLGEAPQFKSDAWPDYNEASSTEALRSYRDSVGGDVSEPDNTAQNEKETRNDEHDPTHQGNSDKDIQITKDIRSSIMDADLSFNAKNIKIITRNEHVTLKGVVQSEAEHKEIIKIAGNHANSGKITDELKVDAE
jgi:sporulation protein YlmC with PRC-barrel domain